MSDFNASIKVVLAHEGGYVDNPSDRGGPTQFGITQATATIYLNGEPASVDYIRNLTESVASAIYRKLFWDPLQLDSVMNENLATVILDLAVLRGIPAMIRSIQSCSGVKVVDGKLGPATQAAFDAAQINPVSLAREIVLHNQYMLVTLVVKDPTQLVFLEGWIARTQELLRLVG